jgi:hypothetical protein
MNTEFISLLADLALTTSVIVAVIFGVVQVKSANRDRHERLTLDTLRGFQTREFAGLMLYILDHDFPTTEEGFNALPEEARTNYIQFAQEMESLGIMVAEKFIDMNLVDKTLGLFVISSWEKYKPMYTDLRVKIPDPFLGEYFQWLAERLNERLEKNPRVPYYQTTAIKS